MNRHYIEDVINRGDEMDIDLTDIGIEEGQKYEGIYTTMSRDGVKNAAPIGIVCKGKDKLGCRLFVGTQTLKNIMETRRYVVNITFDPINFVNSTIGNLDTEEFTDDDDLATACRSIAVHGKDMAHPDDPNAKYNNARLGMNSRLDTLQAGVLLAKFALESKPISKIR